MGCDAVSNCNLLAATAYKTQLEYSIMLISNKRMQIAYQSSTLITADMTNDPRVQQLQAQDSYLEMQQKQLETQQKAITAQIESIQKLLDNNISKDFKFNISA